MKNEENYWEQFMASGRISDYLSYVERGKRISYGMWLWEKLFMQDFYVVTGMVISQMPVGEFDRRVCILTREKGRLLLLRKAQDGREANSWQQPTLFLLVNSSCMKEKALTISWKWTSAGILKNCGRIT